MKKLLSWKYLLLLLLLFIAAITVNDWLRISSYTTEPRKPETSISSHQNDVYYQLLNDSTKIDWTRLDGTLQYISEEYDTSDFRLVSLLRILYEFDAQIPAEYKSKIEEVLFNFSYWWNYPGDNSMCYWTENHQILFSSAEYLIGQKYPNTIFPRSGLKGSQLKENARIKILDWLEMRWNYGFIEFYSSVYYKEDIGALINIIDFAEDPEISEKAQIIMDVLMYDVATQSFGTAFTSVSGRAYERSRKGGKGTNLSGLSDYYWGNGEKIKAHLMYGMMVTKKYELPPVLKEIAKDSSAVIIKQSNGLNIEELEREGYFGTDQRSTMMQWGMQAFTNPEVVTHTMDNIRNHGMFSNDFVAEFKVLDFSILSWFGLEPMVANYLDPQQNGLAIQRGNTYTYKTKDYSLYTTQSYHPGKYAYQQHVFGMNIADQFAIFHSHPAVEKDVELHSPNYWVGYGHLPHSVQEKNVNLSIYNIPEKKGKMEIALLDYTYAYFPESKFDSIAIQGKYAFGKKGTTYCALIGVNPLQYRDSDKDDLIQKGKQSFWITEAGSKSEDGSFDNFIKRIKNNKVVFNSKNLELVYESKNHTYDLMFGAEFKSNGKVVKTDYKRFESPYVTGERKSKTYSFEHNGKTLFLDYENLKRVF